MDLLSVGLEAEDKGRGITVGKGLEIEPNKGRTTWSGSAELGAALDAALGDVGGGAPWAAPSASPCATPGAVLGAALGIAPGAASDDAIGMVLESIEMEEGRLLMPTD